MNIGPLFERDFQRMFTAMGLDPASVGTMESPHLLLRPTDRKCPLEAGDILFIDGPDAEVNEKMPFAFEIAISESGVIECEPLIKTLHDMAQAVDDIIVSFRPLLV
jgi:hypothetical protein